MTDTTIDIDVLDGDALSTECDVLVLKYAQGLHGVDKQAADRLAISLTPELLPPDGFRSYQVGNGIIGARNVIFMGVLRLRQFRYREIREFAARSLMCLAGEVPDARHVVFTLHGPGYGLDEAECFLAELAGVIDAQATGDVPSALRRISFVERNAARAKRMRSLLVKELPVAVLQPDPQPLQERLTKERSVLRSVGFDSAGKPVVFVAMPINPETDDLYHYGIESPVDASGYLCERIDKTPGTGDLVDRIKSDIKSATVIVAELSDSNPNVFLEVGFAWGLGKPTVLLVHRAKVSTLPFDVRTQTCIVYDSIQDLETKLIVTLGALTSST